MSNEINRIIPAQTVHAYLLYFSYDGLNGSDVMKLVLGNLLIYKFFIKSSYEAQIRQKIYHKSSQLSEATILDNKFFSTQGRA
jgi:hypothetical protein